MADDEKHSPNSPPSPSSPISHDKEDLHSPPAYPTLEGTGVGSNNDEYEEFLGLHQRFYGSEEWKRCLRKMDVSARFYDWLKWTEVVKADVGVWVVVVEVVVSVDDDLSVVLPREYRHKKGD